MMAAINDTIHEQREIGFDKVLELDAAVAAAAAAAAGLPAHCGLARGVAAAPRPRHHSAGGGRGGPERGVQPRPGHHPAQPRRRGARGQPGPGLRPPPAASPPDYRSLNRDR